jgi:hypothetical protein
MNPELQERCISVYISTIKAQKPLLYTSTPIAANPQAPQGQRAVPKHPSIPPTPPSNPSSAQQQTTNRAEIGSVTTAPTHSCADMWRDHCCVESRAPSPVAQAKQGEGVPVSSPTFSCTRLQLNTTDNPPHGACLPRENLAKRRGAQHNSPMLHYTTFTLPVHYRFNGYGLHRSDGGAVRSTSYTAIINNE